MFNLSKRTYIITGSSRGIGRTTALQLAEAGANIVVSSRTETSCQKVVDEIIAAGGNAIAKTCHIGKDAELQALVNSTLEHFGRIDGLVCNAASNPVYGPLEKLERDAFDLIMQNNLWSQIQLCKLVSPHISQQTGGSIVLISSIAGISGQKMLGAYAISKSGEMQLARNLALEYGRLGIRVNAVAPGLIDTDFSQALMADPKKLANLEKSLPVGRVGRPSDIAGVIGFLLSDAAAYVTGQTIVADGGMLISQSL